MIKISLLNKQGLYDYIHSEKFRDLKHIPISKHRAISQINNPRADENDILLLLAHEESTMVGYLGVLPDRIFFNNESEKCGWMSCIWVDSAHRGKKIAFQLVEKCLEVWNNKIIATEFTAPAKKLYDKTGKFIDLSPKKGLRLYLRSDLQTILPPKKQFFTQIKFLLKAFDSIFNLIFDFRFWFYKNKLDYFRLEYFNHFDDEIELFLKSKQANQLFRRGVKEYNWIVKNPWILSAPAQDFDSKRYQFSSLEKSFDFVPLKIRDPNGKLIAFLVFAKRNDILKLPYCKYDGNLNAVVDVINFHLIKWRIKTFTTYNKEIAQVLKNGKTPALYKKEVERKYIISSFYENKLSAEQIEIEDGDGDCCFT